MAADRDEYKKIITELVRKHMVILGPKIALDYAEKVKNLVMDKAGDVAELNGDPQLILKSLVTEYTAISGRVTQMVLKNLLEKYPTINKLG